jgi:hypothetical protein
LETNNLSFKFRFEASATRAGAWSGTNIRSMRSVPPQANRGQPRFGREPLGSHNGRLFLAQNNAHDLQDLMG